MRDAQENTLLERLQAGDERALSDLSDAYRFKVYQLAFRHLRNKEDAEEVTQDVLSGVPGILAPSAATRPLSS